ncbi:cupredoxin domain-containing protein [Aquamicrobium zhengzhouense]|uniref:Copper-binding protein n=1 Tax=Aquamicrobium zhengzhouense TaxID=2781738 RepID=A0ABS0SEZ7_9HYPH|nr:copper-binding protein [Aquamicrobium zhengzhouense]MBI1621296.1 copper-binding protein [Aquamicrobium zhengzhouense]
MRIFKAATLAVGLLVSGGIAAQAQTLDPAYHGLERLEPLVLGSEDNDFYMEPKEYRLKVGQGYRWVLKAAADFEYGVVAPEFFRNIWIRKIEVGDAEIKTSSLDEIEFEDEGEAELFFVMVRPGTYEFKVRGMESRGMVGKIIVE